MSISSKVMGWAAGLWGALRGFGLRQIPGRTGVTALRGLTFGLLGGLLVGCVQVAPDLAETADRWRPAPGTSWQWQLQGELDTSLQVDAYDIDLFETSAATISLLQQRGVKVICYFSAGSYEAWRPDAAAFPEGALGSTLVGWDERWLDIRAEAVKRLMVARLDLARAKGCDAVEPDNVDGYTHPTGFPLTAGDALRYNRFLAFEAHARGVSIALKNNVEQVQALEPYFDFAINEACHVWDECDALRPFVRAGKAVLGAEYQLRPEAFCPQANRADLDFLVKNLRLDAFRIACR